MATRSETLRALAETLGSTPDAAVSAGGVWGSAGALMAAAVARLTGSPLLFITPHLDAADDVADDLELLTGRSVQQLPAWEIDLGAEHLNDEVAGERLRLCSLLSAPASERDEPTDLIVAPVMALMQGVPSPEALREAKLALRRGMEISPDALAEWLVEAGYDAVEQVDQQGEFARRGGIVDIFPPASALAVRVEFFGDEVDSIRRFDLDTQRSTDHVESIDVASPAGARGGSARSACLLDYLPSETIVCFHRAEDVWELAEEMYARLGEMGALDADGAGHVFDPNELERRLDARRRMDLSPFAPHRDEQPDLGAGSLETLSTHPDDGLARLESLSQDAQVHVFCENPAERERFAELLAQRYPALLRRATLAIGHLTSGFHWARQNLLAVGHHELFGRYSKVRRIRRVRAGRPIESMLDLQAGEHVVHVSHGIAKFDGLRTLERDGTSEEYLRLRFADNAVLHVPASKIDLVQRYIGTRGAKPNLSKLGGKRWAQQKQKVSDAVLDMAAEMLRIQATRRDAPGVSYPSQTDWQRRFADEFLYSETEDQLSSMRQIDADMLRANPMDRLLCGDVGYGKTELAMRAAFKAVEAGRQVAVLVPTTVLAEQHYRTFRERFADYPFEIEMLSRFRAKRRQAEILKQLALGKVDILIGTHRILSKDVRWAELGLVVIDEEQRFGVEHKDHFKQLRATVDVLTLTATPIPRTLHMSLLGLRDISSLTTPPMDRRAIRTEVHPYDEGLIRQAISRELNRQGQVFFVHNKVMDIQSLADRIAALVPDARVDFGHGQMPARTLEKVMLRFLRKEIDVLVCTTIIESGLDIPSANTMIVHDADRFGLAQLHQLRGRVGRYKHRAYCYLLLPERRPVSPVAAKRLKAIEEFSDLGAGFQIAMRDLEIRGAGNILGKEQSGHIAAVGYELYCQLLDQAVGQLRKEAPPERVKVHVDLGLEAYIPPGYVASERQRMEVYRRLARCQAPADVRQLASDLADAYGPVPPRVETLLDQAEIRVLAGQLGVESIVRMDPDVIFTVTSMERVRGVFEGSAGSARMPDANTVHWRLPPAYRQMPSLVVVLLKRLRAAAGEAQAAD